MSCVLPDIASIGGIYGAMHHISVHTVFCFSLHFGILDFLGIIIKHAERDERSVHTAVLLSHTIHILM
jgi:hypothetical protein